jgi:tRNA wybutosine-synthesizing protein 4
MGSPECPSAIARFGASVVNHQGQTWVVGGVIRDEILEASKSFSLIDSKLQVSQAVLSRPSSLIPQPLLIGSSLVSTGDSLLVMGGSAVCFSFGTSWNKGCYALRVGAGAGKGGLQSLAEAPKWRFTHTAAAAKLSELPGGVPHAASASSTIIVPRMKIGSAVRFEHILQSAKPVILEGLDLGPCTELWTPGYLKEKIGTAREVSFTDSVLVQT